MSKKLRRQHDFGPQQVQSKWQYSWLGGLAVVIMIVLGLVLFTRDDGIPDDFVPEVIGAPRVAVAQDTFDYGDVKNGTTVETVFEVQNVGDENLSIMQTPQVEVVQGCCPPKAEIDSMSLRPGQQTEIKLRFMMHDGMDGQHEFRISLRTNDPLEPIKTLTVLSNWVP